MAININEFKKAIDYGCDIEFTYKNIDYTILPWIDEGIIIGPQNSDDDKVYKTSDELINDYIIDGKPIKDILDKIEILLM